MHASFLLRFRAFLYDYIFILLYMGVIFIISTFLFPELQHVFQESLLVAQLIGFFLLTFPVSVYFIICDSRLVGRTFGKKKMGIQVVHQDGQQLSLLHSLVRVILKFLPWELSHYLVYRFVDVGDEGVPFSLLIIIVYALIIVYILTAIFTKKKQSLYDLICKTEVVKNDEIP